MSRIHTKAAQDALSKAYTLEMIYCFRFKIRLAGPNPDGEKGENLGREVYSAKGPTHSQWH
jgi:hypothetical protein